jgi:hypothetical protein
VNGYVVFWMTTWSIEIFGSYTEVEIVSVRSDEIEIVLPTSSPSLQQAVMMPAKK